MPNYLPLAVRKVLQETNWNEKEIEVFSTLSEKGALSLQEISEETTIPVSTLQHAIKKLLSKKVIKKHIISSKPYYVTEDIECLNKWLKGFIRQFDNYQSTVASFISQYDYDPQIKGPKIHRFEGIEGIKKSYRFLLENAKNQEIINYFFITDDHHHSLRTFFDTEFVPKRLEKGFIYNSVALDTSFARYYKRKDLTEKRTLRIIKRNPSTQENSEINVVDNLFHYMYFNGKSGYSLIIEDKALAETQRNFIQALS